MTDPRLTPARGDVAAAKLKGQVAAQRFAQPRPHQVKEGVSALYEAPSCSSRLATQLLCGEIFDVYDEAAGCAWGQSRLDDYVGYLRLADLRAEIVAPTHRVAALRTIAFPAPSSKAQPHALLSCNAKLTVNGVADGWAAIAGGGFVFAAHLAPIDRYADDWVACAERYLGAPYLWGGKDASALDCSGLVQSALECAGVAAPRDSDMQERALGAALTDNEGPQRGDLLFWPGHVAIMHTPTTLLHANGHHMATVIEPLADALARLGPPRTRRRLSLA